MHWFDVDKEGLGQLVAGRPKGFIVAELVANAWDEEGVTRVEVRVSRKKGSPYATVSVEDDSPTGFARISDAFTLFAPSGKKGDLGKRGRFNLGEKLVLALCQSAEIRTTTGGIRFDELGRHAIRTKRERGSLFSGTLLMTLKEVAEMEQVFRQLLPPETVKTTFIDEQDGTVIECAARPVLREFLAYLPTVVCDDDTGILKDTWATGKVRVYKASEGGAWLYELGIPVTRLGDDQWDVDVRQKVPLSKERDTVRPMFLPRIRTAVLNEMHQELTGESASRAWVTEALGDFFVDTKAVKSMLDARFSMKRVAADPSDQEATMNAAAAGYVVVHGGSLPGAVWERAKKDGLIPPAGQVFPTRKFPDVPDGVPDIPEDERTPEMRGLVARVAQIGEFLLKKPVHVRIFDHRPLGFVGKYADFLTHGVVYLNLAVLDWRKVEPVLDLLLHEFAHDKESNHLSERYHEELSRLGAKLAVGCFMGRAMIEPWADYPFQTLDETVRP